MGSARAEFAFEICFVRKHVVFVVAMPLIKVQTSVSSPDKAQVEELLKDLSSSLANHLGKPESYVMTAFEADVPMTFGGTTDPVCYVEIKSVGTMGSAKTSAMSQEVCAQMETALGVPKNRTYIEFADAPGAMWGWNGGTFG
ncbi:MAG: phenylpyruvate tautomerase MIF-related protein [Nodosilinea sp.]